MWPKIFSRWIVSLKPRGSFSSTSVKPIKVGPSILLRRKEAPKPAPSNLSTQSPTSSCVQMIQSRLPASKFKASMLLSDCTGRICNMDCVWNVAKGDAELSIGSRFCWLGDALGDGSEGVIAGPISKRGIDEVEEY